MSGVVFRGPIQQRTQSQNHDGMAPSTALNPGYVEYCPADTADCDEDSHDIPRYSVYENMSSNSPLQKSTAPGIYENMSGSEQRQVAMGQPTSAPGVYENCLLPAQLLESLTIRDGGAGTSDAGTAHDHGLYLL